MEELFAQITEAATAVIVTLLAPLVGAALLFVVKNLKRVNISITAATQAQLNALAIDGISKAAEYGLQYFKQHGIRLLGSAKEKIAITHVMAKLPNVTEEEARTAITAMLPHVRNTIDAGTSELVKAVRTPEPGPETLELIRPL